MIDVAVIADRVGWEEKAILAAARARGATAEWLDDGALCCGARDDVPAASAYLLRCRSFVRAPLIAATIARAPDDPSVINPAATIELCSNKVATLARMRQAGLATVPYRLVLTRRDLARAVELLGAPLVLKPVNGGLGRRVLLVERPAVADSVYDYVEHYGQNMDRALIAQPYLRGASDVRLLAVDGRAVAAIERVAAAAREDGGDWRANVEQGATATAVAVDDALVRIAAAVRAAAGGRVLGIDLFRHDGRLLIGEVNHSPLFRGLVEATGVDVAARIADAALATGRVEAVAAGERR